jgi:hypothetical protein
LSEHRELLSQREVLRGEVHAVTQDAADEQEDNPNRAHFTVSDSRNTGLETIVGPWNGSNRNSFTGKAYGIIARDSPQCGYNFTEIPKRQCAEFGAPA